MNMEKKKDVLDRLCSCDGGAIITKTDIAELQEVQEVHTALRARLEAAEGLLATCRSFARAKWLESDSSRREVAEELANRIDAFMTGRAG